MAASKKKGSKKSVPKSKLTQSQTALINFAICHGGDKTWPGPFVTKYLRELKDRSGFADIDPTISKRGLKSYIVSWVSQADPDLKIFDQYHEEFELYRGKTIKFFEMPESVKSRASSLLSESAEVAYDLERGYHNDQELIRAKIEDEKITYIFAKRADREYSIQLTEEQTGAELWKRLQEFIDRGDTLKVVKLFVDRGIRTITSVSLDFAEGEIIAASDSRSYGERELSEDSNKRIRSVLGEVLNLAKIDDEETSAQSILEDNVLFPDSSKKLHGQGEENILLIPHRFHFKHAANIGSGNNVEEETTNQIKTYNLEAIRRDVQAYFDDAKSLAGFIEAYPDYDAEKNAEINIAIQEKGAETTAFGYFVYYVDHDSKILGFKVDFELASRQFRIDDKSIRPEHYERVLAQIRKSL